jgi:outer membrane lipoprotein-sorting protein
MRALGWFLAGSVLFAAPTAAQTADEIIAKYVAAIGGMDKIKAVHTLRRTGKFVQGGGFEAAITQENKRTNEVREEFLLQDLVGVNAYDGKSGWKIEPWEGKKDAESLGEEELKSILEDADFDGPLVDYKQKGYRVRLAGTDDIEGTDVYKLEVSYPNGTVQNYYIDQDTYVPIKIDTKRMVRGAEREYEATVGDYKQVAGWYLPYSVETNVKGSPDKSQVIYDRIEANVPLDDSRFHRPGAAKVEGAKP